MIFVPSERGEGFTVEHLARLGVGTGPRLRRKTSEVPTNGFSKAHQMNL